MKEKFKWKEEDYNNIEEWLGEKFYVYKHMFISLFALSLLIFLLIFYFR